MERFAIKIDNSVKSNLYNICRLCGIDHPKKVSIIDALTLLGIHEPTEDEPDLCRKIFVCVGIKVTKDDQMPQTVCQLCADKINDFFEYREMCSATNKQTRKLLGVPEEIPKPIPVATVGRKRKQKASLISPKIEEEGESILGCTDPDLDDRKDIIGNIPFKGGTKNNKLKKLGIGVASTSKDIKVAKAKVGRKKKQNLTATFIDDDVIKQEEAEIKEEYPGENVALSSRIQPAGNSGFKIKLSKSKKVKFNVTPPTIIGGSALPLLQPKELNNRERRREIETQKKQRTTENKNKKRQLSVELSVDEFDQAIKKLKAEKPNCVVCNQDYEDYTTLNNHLIANHIPTIFEYGCSSCGEYFKTINEQKDHQIWHSHSNTVYNCITCKTSYDKLQTYTRHRSHCQQNIMDAMQPIPNYTCAICGIDFQTQNLHDWHDCYMRKDGNCMRCRKTFSKRSSLFRHAVRCSVPRLPDLPQITSVSNAIVTMPPLAPLVQLPGKKNKKTKKAGPACVQNLIKSEPEANIDDSGNLLKKANELCLEARVCLTALTPDEILAASRRAEIEEEATAAIATDTANVHNETDIDGVGGGGGDDDDDDAGHFNDACGSPARYDSSSDSEAEATNLENPTVAAIKKEPTDDDDVIIIEEPQVPILITSGTSPSKCKQPSKTADLVVIKQEPIDCDDYEQSAVPMLDPSVVIKQELTAELPTSVTPANLESAKRKEKKTKKHKKDKRPATMEKQKQVFPIRIKQEPVDNHPASEFTTDSNVSTVVHTTLASRCQPISTLSTAPLSINIKSEPVQPEYDEYDPNVALNIKQEASDDTAAAANSKQPSLRLKITKNRGTLNAQIIPDSGAGATAAGSSSSESPRNIAETEPAAESTSDSDKTKQKRDKPKSLYKKPALLAQRIREEMLARMAREKAATPNEVPISNPTPSTVIPVISQISAGDGTQIPLIPQSQQKQQQQPASEQHPEVRVKIEKPDDYPDPDVIVSKKDKFINPLARIRQQKLIATAGDSNESQENESQNNSEENVEKENVDEISQESLDANTEQEETSEESESTNQVDSNSKPEENENQIEMDTDHQDESNQPMIDDSEKVPVECDDRKDENNSDTENHEGDLCENENLLDSVPNSIDESMPMPDVATSDPKSVVEPDESSESESCGSNQNENSSETANDLGPLNEPYDLNIQNELNKEPAQQHYQQEPISNQNQTIQPIQHHPGFEPPQHTTSTHYHSQQTHPMMNVTPQQYCDYSYNSAAHQSTSANMPLVHLGPSQMYDSYSGKPIDSNAFSNTQQFENINGLNDIISQTHNPSDDTHRASLQNCDDLLANFPLDQLTTDTEQGLQYGNCPVSDMYAQRPGSGAYSAANINCSPFNSNVNTAYPTNSTHNMVDANYSANIACPPPPPPPPPRSSEPHQHHPLQLLPQDLNPNSQSNTDPIQDILSNMSGFMNEPPPPPPVPPLQSTSQSITQENHNYTEKVDDDVLEDISDDSLGDMDDKDMDWDMENKLLEDTGDEQHRSSVS